jgi:methylated-DNA-[protein]-cysteine S-methyltransferase
MTELEKRLAEAGARVSEPTTERMAAELRRHATESGLLDVAYAPLESPLGELLVAVTPRGLVRIAYPGEDAEQVLEELAAGVSPRILRAPERTDTVRRELDDYFAGRRRTFDLPLDWSMVHGFATQILRATARVPFGSVATYGQVATQAGSPRAARAAGNALHVNPIPIVVPCHRIVPASGGLGGYGGGQERKRYLLDLEGVHPV